MLKTVNQKLTKITARNLFWKLQWKKQQRGGLQTNTETQRDKKTTTTIVEKKNKTKAAKNNNRKEKTATVLKKDKTKANIPKRKGNRS